MVAGTLQGLRLWLLVLLLVVTGCSRILRCAGTLWQTGCAVTLQLTALDDFFHEVLAQELLHRRCCAAAVAAAACWRPVDLHRVLCPNHAAGKKTSTGGGDLRAEERI